jgi:dephospho-CoA kinase
MGSVVGLTGGIASGKSTVANMFSELGVPVVDADQVAREVVAPGSEGLEAVVAEFGAEVLGADGALDRKKLGALVFSDSARRRALEAITHPRIAQRSGELLARATEHAPYALYEAALLVEKGLHRSLAALVVVAAPPELQVARVRARDGLSEEEARARIATQLPLAEKAEVADHVIWNEGDLVALKARVQDVHVALANRFGGQQ